MEFGPGCRAYNVYIVSRDQRTVTSVNEQNLTSFSGSNYHVINTNGQTTHFVPQKLGNFFPDVTALQLPNSKLKELLKEDISQFPKLKDLHLGYNDLESLPADLFEENLDLEYVIFSNNRLNHVGQGILTPLKKVYYVYFSANFCIDQYSYTLSGVPSIIEALNAGCRNDTIDQMHKNKICVNCGEQKGKDNPKTKMEEKLRHQDASML